ncbi:general odorant-binding protein 1 [Plodia interpunctella]|uniref:general odorant-binding protein 1 n=1 Tax=Plodia interpunctella TaxID=58824 RepID=UPI0023682EAC|nr:general odorant-binding protein 1-like isoform X1 [Plodia interpunctella]
MWRGFYPRSLKMSRVLFFFFAMLLVGVSKTDASQETLKHITSGFLRTLDQCKHELQLPDHIVSDLYHYWREDYSLLNRDTGCAILCMSKKLDMVDSEGKLHHGNTREFAEKHGAASDVASKLVSLLHECEKQFESIEDECMKVLEIAKCFRTDVRKLDWAPKMDVIISEVLTEI